MHALRAGIPAMEWYVGEFMHRSGIDCQLFFPKDEPVLETSLKTTVFRIFQECLTNIARHAHATKVNVSLMIDEDTLTLDIRDNGRGITSKEINDSRSLGLLGMQERAKQRGGMIEISGNINKGTTIVSQFPLLENVVSEEAR